MLRFFLPIALCLPLLVPIAVAQNSDTGPRGLKPRPAPTAAAVHASADGRFKWTEGENFVTVYDLDRQVTRRLRLPSNLDKPSSRKVLFADRGRYFCLVDEYTQEIGLHLTVRKGAKKAKAMIVNSTLRLIDEYGNTLWLRKMPDNHVVGDSSAAQALRVSNDGILAVLLQDIDPYEKARPILIVLSPRGFRKLRLDYTSWSKVDEFALSDDGRYLVVHGYGLIPEEERWDKALGFYRIGSDKSWVVPMAEASEARNLKTVDSDGWACCVREDKKLFAVNFEGRRKAMGYGPP